MFWLGVTQDDQDAKEAREALEAIQAQEELEAQAPVNENPVEMKRNADNLARKQSIKIKLFAAALAFIAFCIVLGFAPVILPLLGVTFVGSAAIGIAIAIGLAVTAAAVGGGVGALLGKFVNFLSRPKAANKTEATVNAELSSTASIIANVGGAGVAPSVKSERGFASCNDQVEFMTPPSSPRQATAPASSM